MPSGGRRRTTWTKQTRPKGGRPKGAKDKIPRSFKGSMKAMFEAYAHQHPDELWKALDRGVKAPAPKSFPYLQMVTAYIDGKPSEAVPVEEVYRIVRAVGFLFVDLVQDVALRRRFVEGVRQLVGDGSVTIDAQPGRSK